MDRPDPVDATVRTTSEGSRRASRRIGLSARVGAALAAGMLLVAGCTLPPDTTGGGAADETEQGQQDIGGITVDSGEAAALPDNWPSDVPASAVGTLASVDSDAAGTYFSATWNIPDVSPKEAADTYGATLPSDYTASEPFYDDTSALLTYTGSTYVVTIYAQTAADGVSTDLNVTVNPVS